MSKGAFAPKDPQNPVYGGWLPKNVVEYTNPEKWGFVCPVCEKFVAAHDAWWDHDDYQKHFACLSQTRLAEVKG